MIVIQYLMVMLNRDPVGAIGWVIPRVLYGTVLYCFCMSCTVPGVGYGHQKGAAMTTRTAGQMAAAR